MMSAPKVVVIAGPNGAGKSTSSSAILRGPLRVDHFVNADVIAQGLSAFEPEQVAIAAGRIMLARLRELAEEKADFAFETTLASRSFAPWIAELVENGYDFHLTYVWLHSADAAVARVAQRVRRGGHNVPEESIRRRYTAGVHNFFELYQPLAVRWQVMDGSRDKPKRIASGSRRIETFIGDEALWKAVKESER